MRCEFAQNTTVRDALLAWTTITTAAPRAETLANHTTAILTRDAIGWALRPDNGLLVRDHHELTAFGAIPAGTYWPMLWLRPTESAHAVVERTARLGADLDHLVAQHVAEGALDPRPLIVATKTAHIPQ